MRQCRRIHFSFDLQVHLELASLAKDEFNADIVKHTFPHVNSIGWVRGFVCEPILTHQLTKQKMN